MRLDLDVVNLVNQSILRNVPLLRTYTDGEVLTRLAAEDRSALDAALDGLQLSRCPLLECLTVRALW